MRLIFHEFFLFFLMAIIAGSTAIPTAIAAAVYPDRLPSNISAGQTFDIGVKVDPQSIPIAGAQMDISYDKSVLKINSITEGNLFKQYGATTIFNGGVIDSSLGRVVNIYVSIIGQKNVQIPGTFIIINFTALNSTNDPRINLENVRVVDPNGNQVYPAPALTPGQQDKETGGSVSGAGGAVSNSGENYTNIEFIEKYDLYIYRNVTTYYRFKEQTNPIVFVNITGNSNPYEITTSVEVLKNTSTLVKSSASGLVYKNVNIWAGYFGYATPDNIKHAEVVFRVPVEWMEANNINPDSIEMMRYDDGWQSLPTRKIGTYSSNSNINILYESSTIGFSFFAIKGKKSTGEMKNNLEATTIQPEDQACLNNYLLVVIFAGIVTSSILINKIRTLKKK